MPCRVPAPNAGWVEFTDVPVTQFLNHDDRIEIADGLARGDPVKMIAARVSRASGPSTGIAHRSKPDGRYQPLHAHGQVYLRRCRPRPRVFEADARLLPWPRRPHFGAW